MKNISEYNYYFYSSYVNSDDNLFRYKIKDEITTVSNFMNEFRYMTQYPLNQNIYKVIHQYYTKS